ncbi:hypothetical protein N657DRAFT_626031 [Parathielavia appendiculata]|uniref:FAD-binding FR-type domain-containing protein n=1 Tax=Parathielavia appendiculata TaxID=2587402 RepID=A0AAN6YZF7_9PEZI|nr:hypothetical protein N657DRAFT_626031 [Parathielavia appendiculata]
MESTQYYILFICGILLSLSFRGFWLSSGRSSVPYLKVLFARKIRYAALPRWVAITRLELLALLLYFGANSLALALGLPATDVRGFEQRAARLALINMIPLYLGGLANRLADLVGIPLSLYYFAHFWVGRVVVVEVLLHAVLAIALRPIPGQLPTSGYLVASVGGVWLDDRVVGFEVHTERPVHVLPGGYFHIFLPGSIFRYHFFSSYPALALWKQTENSRSIQGIENVQDISFIISRSRHTERLDRLSKGQWILLHGPYGHNLRLESYENVILVAKGIGILGVLQHAFCIALRKAYDDRIRGELRDIAAAEKTLPVDKRSLIERKRKLSRPGWNAQLPESSDALSQRPLFCDSTRQLDVFWILDDNSQGIWVANEIEALKRLDPLHTLLVFLCMIPSPPTGTTPFKESSHFSCLYPRPGLASFDKLVRDKIQLETRSPGKVAVIG